MIPVTIAARRDALRALLIVGFMTALLFLVGAVTETESKCVVKYGADRCKEVLR